MKRPQRKERGPSKVSAPRFEDRNSRRPGTEPTPQRPRTQRRLKTANAIRAAVKRKIIDALSADNIDDSLAELAIHLFGLESA